MTSTRKQLESIEHNLFDVSFHYGHGREELQHDFQHGWWLVYRGDWTYLGTQRVVNKARYHLDGIMSQLYGFTFNHTETLYDRVLHERLIQLVIDIETDVLDCTLDTNSWGEFLFITLRRGPDVYVFYSLGLHEYRNQWITDTWQYFRAPYRRNAEPIPSGPVIKAITERLAYVNAQAAPEHDDSSELYNLIADLTDEDGAWAELSDLGLL